MKKCLERLKSKWLKNMMLTILLVAIVILAFVAINIGMQKLDISDIDVTKEKIYTVSDTSKMEIEKIEKKVNIYFFGYSEEDSIVTFAKQYNKINSNIEVEVVDLNKRPDLVEKYQVTESDQAIVIESENRQKILTQYDLYSYDYTNYEQIDLTEQKITNAIISVTEDNIPVVYFLTGHEEYGVDTHMTILKAYLENDINDVETLNLLTSGGVPENCSSLVIASPQKDFTDYETDLIVDYINKGGNILWLNDPNFDETEKPNITKILNLYGVEFDQKGVLLEQDSNKMIIQNSSFILPELQSSNITKDLSTDGKIALFNSGRIKFDEEKIDSLGLERTDIITSSATSFYRSNLNSTSSSATSEDEKGEWVVGSSIRKSVGEEKYSTLIAFANNIFVTDYNIQIGNQSQYAISIYNNKDLVLNAIAYLNQKEDSITIRKDMGVVTYTATQKQDTIIRAIIFIFPIIIIVIGIIVWQKRRRRS